MEVLVITTNRSYDELDASNFCHVAWSRWRNPCHTQSSRLLLSTPKLQRCENGMVPID